MCPRGDGCVCMCDRCEFECVHVVMGECMCDRCEFECVHVVMGVCVCVIDVSLSVSTC